MEILNIDGQNAELATYKFRLQREAMKHRVQLHIRDVYPEKSKDSPMKTSLVVNVAVNEKNDVEIVKQVLLSVKFDGVKH